MLHSPFSILHDRARSKKRQVAQANSILQLPFRSCHIVHDRRHNSVYKHFRSCSPLFALALAKHQWNGVSYGMIMRCTVFRTVFSYGTFSYGVFVRCFRMVFSYGVSYGTSLRVRCFVRYFVRCSHVVFSYGVSYGVSYGISYGISHWIHLRPCLTGSSVYRVYCMNQGNYLH